MMWRQEADDTPVSRIRCHRTRQLKSYEEEEAEWGETAERLEAIRITRMEQAAITN